MTTAEPTAELDARPVAVILRPPRVRQLYQPPLVVDARGGAFDDDIARISTRCCRS